MSITYISRPWTHATSFANRPILGVVWHDTESRDTLTTFQSAGGWHWQIDRAGTIYRDCPEVTAAWHTDATDKWRPPWVVKCPGKRVSDANYCTIGVELVSDATWRASGVPFTQQQYTAVRALALDIEARHGPLWHVGHGELQANRTDPVQFDWPRGGFGARGPNGRSLLPSPDPGGNPVRLLEDWQVKGWILADLYQQAGVPFNPDSGVNAAWLSEFRALRYRGLPVGAEHPIGEPRFGVWQQFEGGVVVYRDGDGVTSWEG